MASQHVEVNFIRLLSSCERMAVENHLDDWRFDKYLVQVVDYLTEMQQRRLCADERLKTYEDRLTKLKRSYDTFKHELAELPKRPAQNLQSGENGSQPQNLNANGSQQADGSNEVLNSTGISNSLKSASSKRSALAPLRENGNSNSVNVTESVRRTIERSQRDALLSTDRQSDVGLRRRETASDKQSDGHAAQNSESLIDEEEKVQERLVSDMLSLAGTLKQTAVDSQRIIRDDVDKLDEMNRLGDANSAKLHTEQRRVETRRRGAFRDCYLFIVLGLVFVTFLWTVLFIKFMPKR